MAVVEGKTSSEKASTLRRSSIFANEGGKEEPATETVLRFVLNCPLPVLSLRHRPENVDDERNCREVDVVPHEGEHLAWTTAGAEEHIHRVREISGSTTAGAINGCVPAGENFPQFG